LLKKPVLGFFNSAAPALAALGHPARHKAKSAIFALLHFSSTYTVLEKWRRFRILRRLQAQGKPSPACPLAASQLAHAPHAGCFSTAC
jgi:hypothetical protein